MKLIAITRYFKLIVISATLILYASSLFMPALIFERRDPLSGMEVLFDGALGLIILDFSWLANPLYWLSIRGYYRDKYIISLLLSALALIFGSLSLQSKAWWFNEGSGTPIIGLGSGFYIWMGSFTALLIGSLMSLALSKLIKIRWPND